MKNSIIQDIDKQMQLREGKLSESGLLRELFDYAGSQYNGSTIDDKLEALKILVNDKNENILELIYGMIKTYNDDRTSNLMDDGDVILILSKFLEASLKKCN